MSYLNFKEWQVSGNIGTLCTYTVGTDTSCLQKHFMQTKKFTKRYTYDVRMKQGLRATLQLNYIEAQHTATTKQ